MQTLQFSSLKSDLKRVQVDRPRCAANEVTVELKAAALNRRDYWIQQGMYPGVEFPLVPGSDGAGICNGKDVIIDAGIGWGMDENVQAEGFHLLGFPTQGTFAEEICVPESNVYNKPEHLSNDEAAALPVAGVTAYRALFVKGTAAPGERILIAGVGGGVALMLTLFAIAHGMEVYVTSGSDKKIQAAIDLGARGGVNYREGGWQKKLKKMSGGFDLIVDGAGGEAFAQLPKLSNPGGRIVIYGGSLGYIDKLSPQIIFWRQISIIGTSMGSPTDFSAMLDFVNKNKIKPVIDSVSSFGQANEALERLAMSKQFGKVVLNIPT
jgi:zinc-binding alcohol dehydrogenase/oxidoreductase